MPTTVSSELINAIPRTAAPTCENVNERPNQPFAGSGTTTGSCFTSLSIILLILHHKASELGGRISDGFSVMQESRMTAKSSQTFAHSPQTARCVWTVIDTV